MSLAPIAVADDFSSCWVTESFDSVTLDTITVTRCRLSGGDTVDYAGDYEVPSVLYANIGTDLTGPCWFLTSATTQYVIITRYGDGSADIGLDIDPSDPGVAITVGPALLRCTTEPTPLSDPLADAWNYVMAYIHNPPVPELSPPPGDGVTGMATIIGVSVPGDHAATLAGGPTSIDVEITVDAVVVDWGDGQIESYPADETVLAGYPTGRAAHTYETKNPDGVDLTVEYDWTARWRTPGNAWAFLPVPNTTTTTNYPIAEIISRLSG